MHMIQKYVLILLIASFAAISIYFFQNKNYHQNNLSTMVENQEGIPGGHFALTTHNGERYNSASDKNLKIIYFGFTYCPDVCPTTLINMANTLEELKDKKNEITPLFISVDPERDNLEILSKYVSAFHSNIIGLTGSVEDIEKVAADWKVYYKKEVNEDMPDNYIINHLDIIFIANKNNNFVDFVRPNTSYKDIANKLREILRR
jgi:protein SCO1/2